MISVYQLKKSFQNLLRPITKSLAKKGVTANQVTIFAMLLSGCQGALILFFPQAWLPYLLMPIVLFVRMALNAIDGMLAREHNMKSKLGTFLNELGDVVSDTVLYLPFVFVAEISGWLVVPVVILSIISEMTGVIATQVGSERRYDGPMGKSDRAFVMGAFCLFVFLGLSRWWGNWVFAVMFLLLLITIYKRTTKAIGK